MAERTVHALGASPCAHAWSNTLYLPHNAAPRRMRTIKIKVKPGAREEGLRQLADGSWVASVKAQPVDGKANAALIALVATHFGVRKVQVGIRSGAAGRMKLVQIRDEQQ